MPSKSFSPPCPRHPSTETGHLQGPVLLLTSFGMLRWEWTFGMLRWGWTFGMLRENEWCFLILYSLSIFPSSNKDMAPVVRTVISQSQQKYQKNPHSNPDIIQPLTHLYSGSYPESLLRCHLSKPLLADHHLEVPRSITKPLWPTASSSVRWRQVVS